MAGLFGGIDLDFGTPLGLSLRVDTQRDIDNIRRDEMLERQRNIDAQTKAKLFADDIQFGNAANPWDHKLLKGFSESKVKEIGSFVTQNPDWNTNPQKLLQLKKLKNDLIDNDIVLRSERIKAHNDSMNKWLQDPKNKELISLPEVLKKRQEYDNYIKTGSIDGITGNGREFTWQQPEMGVDISSVFSQRAKLINRQGTRDFNQGNKFVTEQFVRREDVMSEAQNMIQDQGLTGIAIRKQYQDLVDNGSVNKETTIEQWAFDQLWNNRLESRRQAMTTGQYRSRNGGSGSGNVKPYRMHFTDPTIQPTQSTLKDWVSFDKNGVYTTTQGAKISMQMEDGSEQFVPLKSSINRTMKGVPKPFKRINPENPEEVLILTEYEIPLGNPEYVDIVEELGASFGLLNSTEWFQFLGNNFDEAEDIEINDSKTLKIVDRKDKEGNDTKVLLMNAWTPHLFNSTAEAKHDQGFFTKTQVGFDPQFPGQQQAPILSGSGDYLWNGQEWVPINQQ